MKRAVLFRILALTLVLSPVVTAAAQSITGERVVCQGGSAAGFACQNVDLLSVLTLEDAGSPLVNDTTSTRFELSDIWGWYHESSGREFAIVGRQDGTSFIEVTDPVNPILIGTLAGGDRPTTWRDVKVYEHYAYIVQDQSPRRGAINQGVQIFNLEKLLEIESPPRSFEADANYLDVPMSHNIFIHEESGFAYLLGSRGNDSCGPGLHILDLTSLTQPEFAGCFANQSVGRQGDGYTHDVQCVNYHGPDADYRGREICFGSNETAITIVDVTDKSNTQSISKGTYPNVGYIHQGWLDDSHRFFYQNDELDEFENKVNRTRTLVWDIADLDDPVLAREYFSSRRSLDHNMYTIGNFLVQSNYTAGLVILDISTRDDPVEAGFFDVDPDDRSIWDGSWSNYPYFRSGAIGVTSSSDGFFLLDPTIDQYGIATDVDGVPESAHLVEVYPNPMVSQATVALEVEFGQRIQLTIHDLLGREIRVVADEFMSAGSSRTFRISSADLTSGVYLLRATGQHFAETREMVVLK